MKKNKLLYTYEATTNDVKDLTKNHIIKMYDAEVKEVKNKDGITHNLTKGTFLYEYEYIPLLNQIEYKRLLSMNN